MTQSEERRQIARNANAAKKAGCITKEQYNDVRLMLIRDFIEKKVLTPHLKGQTK